MKIIADVNGWRKEMDIDDDLARKGRFVVDFNPCISLTSVQVHKPVRDYSVSVMVFYKGKSKEGLPVFGDE